MDSMRWLFANIIQLVQCLHLGIMPALGITTITNATSLERFVQLKSQRGLDYGLIPVRPNEPVHVNVSIYINTIGDINEASMAFSLNIYLRQEWNDHRLAFEDEIPDVEDITLPDNYNSDIWLPDPYAENAISEKFHVITLPNRMFRLRKNGDIYYSIRLTFDLHCTIDLRDFPMDQQRCRLQFMSYRYNTREIILAWEEENAVQNAGVSLSLFDLKSTEIGDCSWGFATGRYSCVYVEFTFHRKFGYYLTQIYVPSLLVVFLSWVSFWLDPSAVPARVSLGLLTILTMTNQMSSASASLPKVSYVKAIDIWLTTCLVFLFGGLVQFALVNSMQRRESIAEEKHEKERQSDPACQNGDHKEEVTTRSPSTGEPPSGMSMQATEDPEISDTQPRRCHGPWKLTASRVDKMSRLMFPLMFALFNAFYWAEY